MLSNVHFWRVILYSVIDKGDMDLFSCRKKMQFTLQADHCRFALCGCCCSGFQVFTLQKNMHLNLKYLFIGMLVECERWRRKMKIITIFFCHCSMRSFMMCTKFIVSLLLLRYIRDEQKEWKLLERFSWDLVHLWEKWKMRRECWTGSPS